MDAEQVMALERRYGSGLYGQVPIVLTHGRGARVWDTEGREYIDCIAGHGVGSLGHAHPALVEAIQEQAAKLIVSSASFFYHPVRAELMERLVELSPPGLDRVFFCNSGAEAVEAALKFARLSTGRIDVIAAKRGFHGRTFGALSATWRPEYRQPFEPLVPGFRFVTYNSLEEMEQAIDENTAAVILEVVQGEGGVYPGDGEYLRGVQALCQDRGALFIVDEVQTGFGRTGKLFAVDHYGLDPDLMCLAKGIAGGVPMGAVLIGDRVGELPKKVHGSTFGGNPLACAAALATVRTLVEEKLPERASELGERLLDELRSIDSPLIREVRGLGLMIGIELKRAAAPYLAALAQHGVLALSAGRNVIRLLPPLVIEEEEIEMVVQALATVLGSEV